MTSSAPTFLLHQLREQYCCSKLERPHLKTNKTVNHRWKYRRSANKVAPDGQFSEIKKNPLWNVKITVKISFTVSDYVGKMWRLREPPHVKQCYYSRAHVLRNVVSGLLQSVSLWAIQELFYDFVGFYRSFLYYICCRVSIYSLICRYIAERNVLTTTFHYKIVKNSK